MRRRGARRSYREASTLLWPDSASSSSLRVVLEQSTAEPTGGAAGVFCVRVPLVRQ